MTQQIPSLPQNPIPMPEGLLLPAKTGLTKRWIPREKELFQFPAFLATPVSELCREGYYVLYAGYFLEKFPYIYRNINRRDHRKVVIIDGKIGYIGGINIGDEYIHKSKKFDAVDRKSVV